MTSSGAMATLLAAVSDRSDGDDNPVGLLVCWSLVFAGIGLWLVIAPRKAWRLRHTLSLMYKDPESVEPSTFAIVFYRISGVFAIALAVSAAALGIWLGPL